MIGDWIVSKIKFCLKLTTDYSRGQMKSPRLLAGRCLVVVLLSSIEVWRSKSCRVLHVWFGNPELRGHCPTESWLHEKDG